MMQERDIEFYVDRRDAGETNQELYNLFLRMFEIYDSQTFFVKKYRLEDRKSTRLNSSHLNESRMPSSA